MAFITNLTNAIGYTGVYVDGRPSGVDNDQGNIRGGGTVGDTALFTSSPLGEESGLFVLVSSGVNNTGIIAPATASTFNNQPGQVIVKYTTELAGVANLTQAIRSAGNSGIFSINQKQRIRSLDYKTSVVAGNWNIFSGAFSPALSTTLAGGWNIIGDAEQAGTLATDKTDKAANPSQLEPGHFAYMAGALGIPTTGTYSSRSIW